MFIVPFHTLVADMFEKMIPVRELAKQNFEYWLQKCDEDESAKNVLGASSLEQSGEKIFWKIDYYDVNYEFGSENPSNLELTRRVLTVMFADEY